MHNQPDLQQVNAFVDGELDLASQLEIEVLLRNDAALRAQVESVRRLRETVRDRADYHAAPAALRARIQALVAAPSPTPARWLPHLPGAKAAAQRWFAWRPFVSSFGVLALLTVTLNLTLLHDGREERLGQEVIASHVRATLAQHLVDVQSSDHHTVKPWLSARLDFSPPVRELKLPGSVFVGGRVDYLDGRPVAALVYKQGEHVVDSFIWPTTEADQPLTMSSQRGFHLAHWSRRGMEHWVVSDLNREEFAALVRELNASDAAP